MLSQSVGTLATEGDFTVVIIKIPRINDGEARHILLLFFCPESLVQPNAKAKVKSGANCERICCVPQSPKAAKVGGGGESGSGGGSGGGNGGGSGGGDVFLGVRSSPECKSLMAPATDLGAEWKRTKLELARSDASLPLLRGLSPTPQHLGQLHPGQPFFNAKRKKYVYPITMLGQGESSV
jgi:hypothetical protein